MSENEIGEDFIHRKYGYCYFEIEHGKKPIIFNLYVHPEYRRQGYARKLLQYVISEIRQTGYIGDIDIEVSPRENSISKEKLESFYVSMGLTVINPGGQDVDDALRIELEEWKSVAKEMSCAAQNFANQNPWWSLPNGEKQDAEGVHAALEHFHKLVDKEQRKNNDHWEDLTKKVVEENKEAWKELGKMQNE